MILRPPRSTRTDTLFPYTTLFRSPDLRGDVDVNGNPLTRAPTVSANIAGEYRIPLTSGEIKLRADGSYRSRVYYTPFKSNLNSSDHYWVLGASARFDSNQNWRSDERRLGKECVCQCKTRWGQSD